MPHACVYVHLCVCAGEAGWQQRDELYRVSTCPRQGGAVAKPNLFAHGNLQTTTSAKLFVGSRYQAQVRLCGWSGCVGVGEYVGSRYQVQVRLCGWSGCVGVGEYVGSRYQAQVRLCRWSGCVGAGGVGVSVGVWVGV